MSSSSQNQQLAIEAWQALLGERASITLAREFESNVEAISRRIPIVLFPETREEIAQILKIANEFRAPVHAVSIGKNWGFGSALPPREDVAILSLERFKQMEMRGPHVRLEPGVTQKELYEFLKETPHAFSVTGAAESSSVLGNSLERGLGYFGIRSADLLNMEVMLPNGEMVQTGFGRFPVANTKDLYSWGVGPALDGLFFQSNLGIVLAATVKLFPRPSAVLVVQLDDEQEMPIVVETLSRLRVEGVFTGALHLGNSQRGKYTFGAAAAMRGEYDLPPPSYAWVGIASLFGSEARLDLTLDEVQTALHAVAKQATVRVLREPEFPEEAREVLGFAMGEPSNCAIASIRWAARREIEVCPESMHLAPAGVLFCNPVIPAKVENILEWEHLLRGVEMKNGVRFMVTLNFTEPHLVIAIINLAFDKANPDQTALSLRALDELRAAFESRGLLLYRDQVEAKLDYNQGLLGEIKRFTDPNGILL